MSDAPAIGAKSIAVFGDLSMHGADVQKGWTKLATTAEAGSREIELTDEVSWETGSSIVISATSYEPNETEFNVIKSVNGKKLELENPLR